MTFHNAVDLGKAQACPCFSLRCEERLERTLTYFRRHTDASVTHLDIDFPAGRIRPNGERATASHRVERVLTKVQQRLTKLASDAPHHGAAGEIALELHHSALGALRPERPSHRHDLVTHLREIHQL